MPFTPAHMMAVLPLVGASRLPLDRTCLLLGAMAPDFEYFVRGRQVGELSHSWLGLVVFCVPMTLVLAVLFHHVLKWPALMMLPPAWSARLVPAIGGAWPARRGWTVAPIVLASAALGATTHLVWDGFTHGQGFITRAVPALLTRVDVPGLGPTYLCRVLQHASTIVGLIVVGVWLARRAWPAPIALPPAARARAWTIALVAITVGIVLLQLYAIARGGRHGPSLGDRIVAIISGGLLGTMVAATWLGPTAARWCAAIEPRPGGPA